MEEEKRILHSQLTKRDEELMKLYEQLKIQQSNLLHGENEYKAVCACRELVWFNMGGCEGISIY